MGYPLPPDGSGSFVPFKIFDIRNSDPLFSGVRIENVILTESLQVG